MSNGKVGFLFPAFAMKFRGTQLGLVPEYKEEEEQCLTEALALVDLDLDKFRGSGRLVLDDRMQNDLQDHYGCFVRSCAVHRLLKRKDISCEYIAGYSMGIFAAFICSGALSFEDGLILMHHVCTFAHRAMEDDRYGMAVVVGLGIKVFVECGLSDSLCHLAKFFPREFQAYHPKRFNKLFESGFKEYYEVLAVTP